MSLFNETVKIYNELLNGTYYDDELAPVLNSFYRLTNLYNPLLEKCEREICRVKEYKQGLRSHKDMYIREILPIFKDLAKSNNEYIDSEIDFIMETAKNSSFAMLLLKIIFAKEHGAPYNIVHYLIYMGELIDEMNNVNYKGNYDFPLYKMICCSHKYLHDLDGAFDSDNRNLFWFMRKYGPILVGYYHLYGYDVDDLEEIMKDIILDFNHYISYFELNGIDPDCLGKLTEEECLVIESIIDNKVNKKRKIN